MKEINRLGLAMSIVVGLGVFTYLVVNYTAILLVVLLAAAIIYMLIEINFD